MNKTLLTGTRRSPVLSFRHAYGKAAIAAGCISDTKEIKIGSKTTKEYCAKFGVRDGNTRRKPLHLLRSFFADVNVGCSVNLAGNDPAAAVGAARKQKANKRQTRERDERQG